MSKSAVKKPVEIFGVKGLKSVPFRKVFPSEQALEKFLEKQAGNVQVQSYSYPESAK